jgi:lipopolysaccharide export system protein LptC
MAGFGDSGARSEATLRQSRPLIGHAQLMRILKIALPAAALMLILVVALWPRFLIEGGRFRILADEFGSEGLNRLSMVNARFEGTDRSDRPFTVTADRATQDLEDTDLIELIRPKADMTLEDGNLVALTAEHGLFRRDDETLKLSGGVDLVHARGYTIRTLAADINLKTGTAEGSDPVSAKGPFGAVTSQGFRVAQRGGVIVFTGNAKLILNAKPEELP